MANDNSPPKPAPLIPLKVLEYLEARFPAPLSVDDLATPAFALQAAARLGQQSLLDHLRSVYGDQQRED